MKLRTISRLAAVAAIVVSAGAAVASVASATGQDRITVRRDEVLEFDYPALIGNNAAVQIADSIAYDPATCETVTYCDTIPITVEAPADLSDDADYFVVLTVTWETQEFDAPVLGPSAVNDIDMVLWHDPMPSETETTEDDEEGPDADGIFAKSKTFTVPEVINLYRPVGDFLLVVSNVTGANIGYHLTVEWVTDIIGTPFESLPPEFSGGPVRPSAPARPTPAFTAPRPVAPPVSIPPARTDLAIPGGATADDAFGAGFDEGAFDDAIAAPPTTVAGRYAPPPVQRLESPSGVSLLLWMLALPLAVVAIGAGFLSRRQRGAVDID